MTTNPDPAAPQYRVDLSDIEALAARWAAKRDGRPMPPLDQAPRKSLIRVYTGAAALGAGANPAAARAAQEQADRLRAGLD